MAEITEEPTEEQPKIKMSDFELSTYGEMYSQGALVPMVVPPRRAEDGTLLDGEGEDGHNYSVALTDLDGRIRMYADAAIESSFDDIVAGAATAAEAQITDEVIRLVHVSMDEYIPGIEETVMAQFPTKVSELENDAGYATTGAMDAALSRKQDTIQDLAEIRSGAGAGATAVQPRDLATVATSGSYNDLENKPTIPEQVNADWNASSGVAAIRNKPTLAAVATTGDYGDLINRPPIPGPQENADWNADSGVAKILNKPELASVATSGNYSDLAGKPSIPAKTSDLSNDSGFIAAADVPVKGVTVNGSSAVNAQGIATITVPTATSALQNDSGFVGTQSAPSANQVLTFNGSAVVWTDPQGGGGSDLPPITPSDEGKFLKVESGAAAWGEGGSGGGGDSVTINIGDVFDSMPADTGMWDKIAEPLFNDKTLHIVASFGGSPIEVKLTETTSIKQIKEDFPQIATFADLKQFIERYGYSRYVPFVLTADISGAGFTASVGYSTGFTPDKLLGINSLTKAGLASNWDGTRYLDITMMCGYYKLDTSDNIWNFIRGEFFLEKDEEDPSIVEPLAIVYASNKKNFDVMYVGEMGALTEATAGNTIYSTDDSEEREWLQGHVNISMTNVSGKPVYKITVRVNGLASKCDSNGNQLPDTPQVPIMWRGIFEWGFKDGIYCYRCTDEQLVALSPAQ